MTVDIEANKYIPPGKLARFMSELSYILTDCVIPLLYVIIVVVFFCCIIALGHRDERALEQDTNPYKAMGGFVIFLSCALMAIFMEVCLSSKQNNNNLAGRIVFRKIGDEPIGDDAQLLLDDEEGQDSSERNGQPRPIVVYVI